MHELVEIPYYPLSQYRVTSDGYVWSVKNQLFLKQQTNKQGYATVCVSFDDGRKRRNMRVHRLVGLAFHGIPEGYPVMDINHRDGNKKNNYYRNLEWSTQTDNNLHGSETGLIKTGFHIRVTDLEMNMERTYPTMAACCRDIGFDSVHKLHGVLQSSKPYQGRYVFELLKGSTNKKRSKVKLTAVDLTSNAVYRTDSILEMSFLTGLGVPAIRKALKRDGLINGLFIWPSNDTEWEGRYRGLTKDQIERSIIQFERKSSAAKNK